LIVGCEIVEGTDKSVVNKATKLWIAAVLEAAEPKLTTSTRMVLAGNKVTVVAMQTNDGGNFIPHTKRASYCCNKKGHILAHCSEKNQETGLVAVFSMKSF
jgi:hypothetical protein